MRTLLDSADNTGIPYEIVAVSDVYGPRRDEVKERSTGLLLPPMSTITKCWPRTSTRCSSLSPDHWHVRIACDALAAGKDVYLEKPVTHTIEEGATLSHAVRSSKQILQCGMQQRSWTHFRNAVDLIQAGSLGRVTQVRTYWWQNYNQAGWKPKPIDTQALDWKLWLGWRSRPALQPEEKFYRWRWYWNFGGGGMTDLFTHWIDVAHWAMKSDTPREAQMLADKYIFDEWDCPDTIQAALRYPGWDVVYEGMMSSSIDDGGLEFRGTEATLKINRSGFGVYREGAEGSTKILSSRKKASATEPSTTWRISSSASRRARNRTRPSKPESPPRVPATSANLAYKHTGQIAWPPKNSA